MEEYGILDDTHLRMCLLRATFALEQATAEATQEVIPLP